MFFDDSEHAGVFFWGRVEFAADDQCKLDGFLRVGQGIGGDLLDGGTHLADGGEGLGGFFVGRGSLPEDAEALRLYKRQRQLGQDRHGGQGAGGDGVEGFAEGGGVGGFFGASVADLHVFEIQGFADGFLEAGLFVGGFQRDKRPLGADDRQDQPGETGTGADIEDAQRALEGVGEAVESGEGGQGIEEVSGSDLLRRSDARQVVFGVFLHEQLLKAVQLVGVAVKDRLTGPDVEGLSVHRFRSAKVNVWRPCLMYLRS